MKTKIKISEIPKLKTELKYLDSNLSFTILEQDSIFATILIQEYIPVINNNFILAIVKGNCKFYCFDCIPDFKIFETQELSFVIRDCNFEIFQYNYNEAKEFLKLQDCQVLNVGKYLLDLQINSEIKTSEYFGNIGTRYKLNLKLVSFEIKLSKIGRFYIYNFQDENHNWFQWKTGDYVLQLNEIYNIKATVVNHEIINTCKFTIITNGNVERN